MGFGPAKSAVSGGGGSVPDGAANSFTVTIRTDIKSASTKAFAKTQAKVAGATSKKISKTVVNNLNADKGVLFSDTPGGLLKDKKAFVGKRKRLLFVGAEGIRIGDARLSRTGFSLSEKTLASTRGLAFAAAGGQVLGSGLTAAVGVRDQLRKGDSLSAIGLEFLKAGPGKVATQIGDLFGVQKTLAALTALVSGEELNAIQDSIKRSLQVALDYDQFITDKLYLEATLKLKEAQSYVAERDADLRKKMQAYPQKPRDQVDFLREDIADDFFEDRLFVRDIGGRPLWRTLGISINEGQ